MSSISELFATVLDIANQYVIPLILGIAVIYFLVALLKYVRQAGDESARKLARGQMVWGIIIIFVMTAVWGLVNVVEDTLGLNRDIPNLPDVPVVEGGGATQISSFKDAVTYVLDNVGTPLMSLIVGAALIAFLWGLLKYVYNADNQTKQEEGRRMIVWGIIFLFVMTAVWGLVNIIRGSFTLEDDPPKPPQFSR